MTGDYTTDEIAEEVGCSRASVTNWVRQWRKGSYFELAREHYKPTRTPALTDEMRVDLVWHLSYSLISGDKRNFLRAVQEWLKQRYSVKLSLTAVKYWLDRLADMFCRREIVIPNHAPPNPLKIDLREKREAPKPKKRVLERVRTR